METQQIVHFWDKPFRKILTSPLFSLPLYIEKSPINSLYSRSLVRGKFTKPYTAETLSKILTGDSFAAAQFEQDPIRRKRRIHRLETSPFFNVLQGFRGGEKKICSIMNRLANLGFVEWQKITFVDSNEEITYQAPFLTQKGCDQVNSGKYFNWQKD